MVVNRKQRTLLLIAGAPGTGKTYTSNVIKKYFPHFFVLPLDLIKQHIYDEVGFDDASEKRKLDDKAYERFYQVVELYMRRESPLLVEYPFSYKQFSTLEKLVKKYQYKAITVRLEADSQILYQRAVQRDLKEQRHPGLLMNHYYRGDQISDESQIDGLPTYKIFKNRMIERGYQSFSLGVLLTLNVNDFNEINYEKFIKKLEEKLVD